MDMNTRRLFLDINEDGDVILSAPKRSGFDAHTRFVDDRVGGTELAPFVREFEFSGRRFTVTVTTSKKEPDDGRRG